MPTKPRTPVKEKVVLESIRRIERRLAKIAAIKASDPVGDLIRLRKDASMILVDPANDASAIAEKLQPFAAEERRLIALEKRQRKVFHDVEEQVDLEMELGDLRDERYLINLRKRQSD